jgi:hypothetical protein
MWRCCWCSRTHSGVLIMSHLLCSIPRQPIWAGARSDNLTRRSRDPPGSETPTNSDSRRLFSWTQQSSQGNDQSTLSKSAQECNSKCSSPYGSRAVTTVNVPDTLSEANVPDTFTEGSVPATEGMELGEFLISTFVCIQ